MKTIKQCIALTMAIVMIILAPVSVSAADQWCNKSGMGYKVYNNSRLETGWSGKLSATFGWLFANDVCEFTGTSYSRWLGATPFYADKITHYDILEIKGIGSVSFSGGIGASKSGVSGDFDISGTTTDKNCVYAYEVTDAWKVDVNYSYYAEIYDGNWMDLYTAATFKFGTSFTVVNSRVDNPTVNSGTIYYK